MAFRGCMERLMGGHGRGVLGCELDLAGEVRLETHLSNLLNHPLYARSFEANL